MNFRLINIGIADMGVASTPDILRTILGSCVGICLYDPERMIAGLSHIMLPSQNERNANAKKYADSAIPRLVEEMERDGAQRERIVAKIAGGSMMFKIAENSVMGEIGRNNIKKVREVLAGMGIKILAEDVGGDYGRTIDFHAEDGRLRVKSLGKSEIIL